MKIARKEYLPLYIVLAATQMFCYIFLLRPLLVSSGWIALTLALIAALIPALCARTMLGTGQPLEQAFARALGKAGARIWYAVAALLALASATAVLTLFTSTVLTYTADTSVNRSAIAITIIVAGLCACMGELAISNCARITLGLMIVVMGGTALGTLPDAHAEHFFPLLGPGPGNIAKSALPLAGMLTLPMLYLFRADTCDARMKRTLPAGMALAALTAALCLAIYTLTQPTLPDMSQSMSVRIAMLLGNGTSGIQLQLPLIVMWNACQLLLLAAQLAIGGSMLRLAVPRMGRASTAVFVLVTGALGLIWPESRMPMQLMERAAYPVMAVGFVVAGILYAARSRQGGARTGA